MDLSLVSNVVLAIVALYLVAQAMYGLAVVVRDAFSGMPSRRRGQAFEDWRVIRHGFYAWFREGLRARRQGSDRSGPGLRFPSLSMGLIRLAERRLPAALSEAERERWGEEMRGDVASRPSRKRIKIAFHAWRKGAPGIPTGPEASPRSVGD